MAEVNYDKLVKLVKSGSTHSEAAEALGVTPGQLSMNVFCQAQVDAGLYKTGPASGASVVKMRGEGNRWELIAARTGLSVAAVKTAYEEHSGEDAATSYAGRGRNFSVNGEKPASSRKTAGAKSKTKTKATSKKSSSKKSTTKASGRKVKTSSARPARKARTLAERRAARAANPS